MFKLGNGLDDNDLDDFSLGNGLDLDMRLPGTPVNKAKIRKGKKISLPGKLRKAKITSVRQGTRNGLPDRIDAAIGKSKFALKRVDRALFNVFEKRRGGIEVKIGKKRF